MSELRWFKSTHSLPNSDCVEMAHLGGGRVVLRDSKDKTGPILSFSGTEWDSFLTSGIWCRRP
ncbi:DUF397 domain-containing protein [Nocardia sp. NPDC055321]